MKYYIITLCGNVVVDVNAFAEAEYEDFQNAVKRLANLIEDNQYSRYTGYTIQSIYC